ncbi:MAG: DUF4843 domain-containing protein [Bacteroidales bacterium]|nr:DUF4843 domain-containing protein [Bacteroidales bacterium]MDD3989683.1 DUF4843 domain-containing protein [Bacteroidales bacterium]MDD4638233.1 DUF4843 domain-containing protein [Bacteroidales bacterium]
MKNYLYLFLIFAALNAALSSCEKELEVYNAGEGLNFLYENAGDTIRNYSFVYVSSTLVQDTIWLNVETIGPLSDKDRSFEFEQIQTGSGDAVSGTHYIPFNDTGLKNFYVIPSGKSKASVPVVLKRDVSLKTTVINLAIRIKSNETFKLFNPDRNRMTIVYTDQLSQPSCWAHYCTTYFGEYGPVKHQWLIEQTKNKWDDDYLSNVLGFTSSTVSQNGTNSNYDSGYCDYLSQALTVRLDAYNADRISRGLDVLKEADGRVVSF